MPPRKPANESKSSLPFLDGCGIYCLASDTMLDWMLGLLESLKANAPHLRVYVIPFDQDITHLAQLQKTYGFEFYESDTLPYLESAARMHLGKGERASHVFRKFSVFWGPLEHFLFLDADVIVQGSLDGLFDAYQRSNLQFAFADTNLDEAYKPGPLRDSLAAERGAQGFNSGCFASSQGIFSLPEIVKAASKAAGVREQFVSQYEQSFFNYLVDLSGIKQGRFSDICPADFGPSVWAALTPLRKRNRRWWLMEGARPKHPLPILHWAGYKCESVMPNARFFLRYRLRAGTGSERLRFLGRFTQRQRALQKAALSPRHVLGSLLRKIRATGSGKKRTPSNLA